MSYFYVMDIPLNANGDGPEMDKDLITHYSYEVWDKTCIVVLTGFQTLFDAEQAADELNHYWSMYGR